MSHTICEKLYTRENVTRNLTYEVSRTGDFPLTWHIRIHISVCHCTVSRLWVAKRQTQVSQFVDGLHASEVIDGVSSLDRSHLRSYGKLRIAFSIKGIGLPLIAPYQYNGSGGADWLPSVSRLGEAAIGERIVEMLPATRWNSDLKR